MAWQAVATNPSHKAQFAVYIGMIELQIFLYELEYLNLHRFYFRMMLFHLVIIRKSLIVTFCILVYNALQALSIGF